MTARVWLVGAGPGDPGLITRRGLEVLRACDVVLYDRLVPEALLAEAPAGAERIFVGKRPGEAHSRQVVADALLLERARAGARVVRLKGGDPFLFGRGGEEAALLAEAGVPFEIVPGVTSALAVPAYAGIPVTHRGTADSVAIATARDVEGIAQHRWDALAGADTIVLLMGVSDLERVAARLVASGRRDDTPVAVIEWGTTPRQRTVVATLETVAGAASDAGIRPPATTVVGDVVRLRDALAWFERRPLFGVRVVVTRPRGSRLAALLSERGAQVIDAPTITIRPPHSYAALDRALDRLDDFDCVAFTSANAVEHFFSRLGARARDARALGDAKVAAVGSSTARALLEHGIRADVVPERFTGRALVRELGDDAGTALLPRAADAPRDLVDALRSQGWKVEEVDAYRNVPVERNSQEIASVLGGPFDVMTFASASSARSLAALVSPSELGLDPGGSRRVACIGPTTEEAARALGFRVDAVAELHTLEGLVAAVESLER